METAAEATVQAAAEITKAAKKLLKAAQEGNIDHIRREGDQLTDVLADLRFIDGVDKRETGS